MLSHLIENEEKYIKSELDLKEIYSDFLNKNFNIRDFLFSLMRMYKEVEVIDYPSKTDKVLITDLKKLSKGTKIQICVPFVYGKGGFNYCYCNLIK